MKRKKKGRKRRRALLRLFVVTVSLVLIFTSKPWKHFASSKQDVVVTPLAINQAISNNFSEMEQSKRMERTIRSFMSKWEITGASLAIMKDEKLIYSKGFGWADKEKNIETEVKHIFRVASVSKLITAVAIMKLIDKGKLSLDSKVFGTNAIISDTMFINAIADKRMYDITVEHLLRHKARFSHRGGDPMFNPVDIANKMNVPLPISTNNMIKYNLSRKLSATPGSSTRYSNEGYLILSKIIEKVTSQSYENYVKREILEPIGCYDMHIARNNYEERYPNEVRYYEPGDTPHIMSHDGENKLKSRCYEGNDIYGLMGAGAWVASPVELLRFIAAIDNQNNIKDIISSKSIRVMTEHNKGSMPIGWVRTNGNDWIRTGSFSGTSAVVRHQSDGYTWTFVTNSSSWNGPYLAREISRTVNNALGRVDSWPDRDMFSAEYLNSMSSENNGNTQEE